jgi:hypothetical protein
MRITEIHTYGTMRFEQDGAIHLDGWSVSTEPPCARHVPADELALMLFQHLAGNLRDEVLNRIMEANTVQRQAC